MLAGLLFTVFTLNDPSLRSSLFNSAAALQPGTPPPRPALTRTAVAVKPTNLPATAAATSAATAAASVAPGAKTIVPNTIPPTAVATRTPGIVANATDLPDVTIPNLTEAAALQLTQQDDKDPLNWFVLALAELHGRKLVPGLNNANTGRLQTAFETGYSLAINNPPLLLAAAKAFAGEKAPVYATYLFVKVLTIQTLASDDRNLSIRYVYMIARGATSSEQTLFAKMTTDFPQSIDAFVFASIAASNIDHFPEALSYLSKASSLNPSYWEIHLARGMLEAAQNQFVSAIGEFKAVQGSPEAPNWMTQEMASMISMAAATLTATAGSSLSPTPTAVASATP